jgi:uncharacterized membrane protein
MTEHYHHATALFNKEHRPREPQNVNELHKAEHQSAGINTRIAVALTKTVGTMWMAYTFATIAIIGLLGIEGIISPTAAILVAWISQTFIQLTLLPIIMVGQNVLGRKSELQADEAFKTTVNSYKDIEHIMQHLSAQDNELLRHTKMLLHILEKEGISLQEINK